MPIPVASPTPDLTGPGAPGALLHTGQVTLGGITLGATDDQGVEWILESLSGWSDPPETVGDVEQRASDHGGWPSMAYYVPRLVEIEASLLANTWDGASEALDRLFEAVSLSIPDTMYVGEGARTLQAAVRQENDPLVTRSGGWARVSLSLVAPDPRRYATSLTTAQTGLPQTTGGLSLPISLPVSIGATVTAGVLTVVNDGNMDALPLFNVVGPAPAGSIVHRGSGRTLTWHEPIAAGRVLVIDTDQRRALLDGTANRVVTGTWFGYNPGVNEVAFMAATYDSAALLISSHRSAWR